MQAIRPARASCRHALLCIGSPGYNVGTLGTLVLNSWEVNTEYVVWYK
jgi:hypothetical protein